MSAISFMNSYGTRPYVGYGNFASGKKLHSAADGAAELAIAQKQERQVRGTNAGTDNISAAKNLLNISDGALSQINDSLQRMGELAIRASGTLMSDSDRASIQEEIDQLKQGISDIASQTVYNETHILDGSKTEFGIATDPNGGSMQVSTGNAALEALGIADFDVTKKFDLSAIDSALSRVSSMRGRGGAQTNALEHAFNNSTNYILNSTASKSRLEDLDYPKAISDMKKKQLLQEYQMHMLRRRTEDEEAKARRLFM